MATPETASNRNDCNVSKSQARHDGPLPFRTCIRLEGASQTARTSSIDAEWDSLWVEATRQSTLETVSARPRFETLPGLGTERQPEPPAPELECTTTFAADRPASSAPEPTAPPPTIATKARRSGRTPSLISILAAALSISLGFVGVFVWRNHPGISGPHSPALSAHGDPSSLLADSSPLSLPPISTPSQPSASVLALEPQAPVAASQAEPPPATPSPEAKPAPRPILASTRLSVKVPAPRLAAASSYRARHREVVATDNPY